MRTRVNKLVKVVSLCFFFYFYISTSYAKVLDDKNNPLPEMVKVFELFLKKPIFKNNPYALVLENKLKNNHPLKIQDFEPFAQKIFLRPQAERMDKKSLQHYKNLSHLLTEQEKKEIFEAFRSLGDVSTVYPKSKEFDYILINGTTVDGMRQRVMSLVDAIEKGKVQLHAKTEIIFLDGERKLFKSETKELILNPSPFPQRKNWIPPSILPQDEREAAEWIWEQLELPSLLRNKKPLFIHASKKRGAARAETEDCVKKWAQEKNPQPGSCLVISDNPYIYYQLLITKNMFDKIGLKNFQFESLGSKIDLSEYDPDTLLGLLLDTLARIIYNESKMK